MWIESYHKRSQILHLDILRQSETLSESGGINIRQGETFQDAAAVQKRSFLTPGWKAAKFWKVEALLLKE